MKVYIKKPVALHEPGEQKINEDFIFPLESQVNETEKLFIVCDGEGGANAGEVASKLVALNIAKFFASHPPAGEIDQDYLDTAISSAEKALSNYKETHPESLQMGTALALLHFGDKQVTLAWVGNTEVVYFDATNQKLITTSNPDLKDENQDSLITGTNKPVKISMRFLPNEDLAAGDFFFLATDGIREHVSHADLSTILKSGKEPTSTPQILLNEIQNLSQNFNKDNYSCYLIEVQKVDHAAATTTPQAAAVAAGAETESTTTPPLGGNENRLTRTLTLVALLAIVACLVGLAAYWSSSQSRYDSLMARAEKLRQDQDHVAAMNLLDSAIDATEDETERNEAMKARGIVEAAFRKATEPVLDEPLAQLTESPQTYLEKADGFYAEGNYEDAAKNYRRAERMREKNNDSTLQLPIQRMAFAFLMAGNEQYEQNRADCRYAALFFERAFLLYESPEVKPLDQDAYDLGEKYRDSCQNNLQDPMTTLASRATSKESTDEGGSAEAPAAEGTESTKSRGLSNLSELKTDKPADSPRPQASPEKTIASANKPSTADQPVQLSRGGDNPPPPSANARISPSSVNNPNLTDAENSQLNKSLSEGKRLYVRAKNESSDYLYKLSAENLVQAGQNLDGAGSYMLAYLYHMGQGVNKDEAEALKYAQQSALQNWPAGHYLYAHLLLERKNSRDSITARASLQRATDLNYPDAIYRLRSLNAN
jgi:serine/threonine protein phosphatase PrpC